MFIRIPVQVNYHYEVVGHCALNLERNWRLKNVLHDYKIYVFMFHLYSDALIRSFFFVQVSY